MPPIIAVPASDMSANDEQDVAFKIINQDNLPTIAIVGETILPFGRGNEQKHKPNVIVHPTRRTTTTTTTHIPINNLQETKQKTFTKSNGSINITTITNMKQLRKKLSYSSSKLDEYNNNNNKIDTKFTKTLDAKLRKLQQKEKYNNNNNTKVTASPTRKPFVTTVKKGEFLEPPPEIANLIGIKITENNGKQQQSNDNILVNNKKLYAYSSQPRVLNRSPSRMVHQSRCEAAAKAAAKITGSVIAVDDNKFNNNNGHNITKRMA